MALEVGDPQIQRLEVLEVERLHVHAAVVLQRANRRNDHHRIGPQPALAALDVDELLGAQVRPKTGLGDDVVGQLEAGLGGNHRVAAMGDVGEGPAVQDGRVVLQGLHQVGLEGVLQQHGHRAVRFQLARGHRLAGQAVADDDVAQALLQVLHRGGQAENRHHLGGHHDVEAVLAREAVGRATEGDRHIAQSAVVHVDHPPPGDAAHIDAQLIAVVDVVVDQRGKQVVGQRDGVEVAGEVQVDVLHRHHLRMAATGRATLDAKHRAERGLAQAHHGLLANAVERIAQADGGGGLAFAGRRRADGGDQDQLAVGPVFQGLEIVQRDLGLVVAIGLQVFIGNAELLGRQRRNAPERGLLRNVDVGCHAALPLPGLSGPTRC